MKYHTFIFLGRSGCGKGTQVKLLQEYVARKRPDEKQFYLSTGNKFREFIKADGYASRLSREIQEKGGIQPEFLAVWLWAGAFIRDLTGEEHMFLDGLPRVRSEAKALDSAMRFYGREKPTVVVIDTSPEWSKKHLLQRGRADDNEEAIDKRLSWFEPYVLPAIEFFRENDLYKVVEVNGEQSIEKVHENIVKNLEL